MMTTQHIFEQSQAAAQAVTPDPPPPDVNIGVNETAATARFPTDFQIAKGHHYETEIVEVTPSEIRSKFIIKGVGITGRGVTQRAKFIPIVGSFAVGDVLIQEVESWDYQEGELVAVLHFIRQKPQGLPQNHPMQAVDDDRMNSMSGG